MKNFLTVATIFCSLQKKEKNKKKETDSWTRAKRTDKVNCLLIQGKWRTQSKRRHDNFKIFCCGKINHIKVAFHRSIR